MKVTIADVAGTRTRYYHAGSGPAVLLLHGLVATADTWICTIDALAEDFSVYAPDLIGRGLTAPVDLKGDPPQPYELDHLFAFVDQLGLDRFSIVGGSYGALVGALMYLRAPERVARMVMVASGSGFNTEAQQAHMLADIDRHADQAFRAGLGDDDCLRRFARIVHDPACLPAAFIQVVANLSALPEVRDFSKAIMRGTMDAERVRPYRIIERFAELRLPVLVLNGREDPLCDWQRAREVTEALPDARLEVWDACGHLPYIEYPERFNRTVRDFLRPR